MDKNIKERWEAIDQGLVPKGYKKTKLGIIPEDWDVKKLGEISFDNSYGMNAPSKEYDGKNKYIRITDIDDRTNEYIETSIVSPNDKLEEKYLLEEGDILFARTGASVGKTYYYKVKDGLVYYAGYLIRFKIKKIYNYKFIFYNTLSYDYKKWVKTMSMRSGQPGINAKEYSNLMLPIPPLEEQERIADILSTWDKAIESYGKLLEEKKERKKGLMQMLLTGEKRIGGFTGPWKEVRLGDVIEEINERTTENNQYPIISVTKDGIMLQSEYFNKQIASEDNIGYKIINKGNLVFSTMNLWMGSLDILEIIDKGIVSPAYKVFSIDEDNNDISFMKEFMKSNKMIWIYNMNSEQGASVVRRNLDLKGLLLSKIYVPYLEEQKAIAEVLATADREIDLLEKLIEELEEEKKGLMQLLLKGIVRV